MSAGGVMIINEVDGLIRMHRWEFLMLKEELLSVQEALPDNWALQEDEVLYEMLKDLEERFKDD